MSTPKPSWKLMPASRRRGAAALATYLVLSPNAKGLATGAISTLR
nr:hypothetical protein [Rhodococcus erythropolis]